MVQNVKCIKIRFNPRSEMHMLIFTTSTAFPTCSPLLSTHNFPHIYFKLIPITSTIRNVLKTKTHKELWKIVLCYFALGDIGETSKLAFLPLLRIQPVYTMAPAEVHLDQFHPVRRNRHEPVGDPDSTISFYKRILVSHS